MHTFTYKKKHITHIIISFCSRWLPEPTLQDYSSLCFLNLRFPNIAWGPLVLKILPITDLKFKFNWGCWIVPGNSILRFSSVQLLSRVRLFATPWTAACEASLSITNSQSPPKPMSIESVMPSNHLILCRSLLLLPSIFPSIRVFSNESALHIRWPKYWSFSFSISPSNEHPGLISFRKDWLDLLAVQGTLRTLLQHHSWKASIIRCFSL